MEFIKQLLQEQPLLTLTIIIFLGSLVGKINVKGITLGTAGVLLVGLIFGHLGFSIPTVIRDLGLMLFIYSVGLTSGPRFFQIFRKNGPKLLFIAFVSIVFAAVLVFNIAALFHLPFDIASGLFAGSLTNTSALVAAVDLANQLKIGNPENVTVGYGIAYPYSMISIILLIHAFPFFMRKSVKQEEEKYFKEVQNKAGLETVHFIIENPNCIGKTIEEIKELAQATFSISRVHRGKKVYLAVPQFKIQAQDIITTVGQKSELKKLMILFGHETTIDIDHERVTCTDIEVLSSQVNGKSISSIHPEAYGVVITRIRRDDLEIIPHPQIDLEYGDLIRIVGEPESVNEFMKVIGSKDAKTEEATLIPYILGLLMGIGLGSIRLTFDTFHLQLGLAGGVFIVGLILGRLGRIGPVSLHVPQGALNMTRDLGLVLFMAGVGTSAGAHFVSVLQKYGMNILLIGAFITTVTVIVAVSLCLFLFGRNTFVGMGAITGLMTNPPALATAKSKTKADLIALTYASIYPASILLKIIVIQILFQVLKGR